MCVRILLLLPLLLHNAATYCIYGTSMRRLTICVSAYYCCHYCYILLLHTAYVSSHYCCYVRMGQGESCAELRGMCISSLVVSDSRTMRLLTTYVSAYYYIRVRILLHTCPHTITYVSAYNYICVRMLLHTCSHATTCVCTLMHTR